MIFFYFDSTTAFVFDISIRGMIFQIFISVRFSYLRSWSGTPPKIIDNHHWKKWAACQKSVSSSDLDINGMGSSVSRQEVYSERINGSLWNEMCRRFPSPTREITTAIIITCPENIRTGVGGFRHAGRRFNRDLSGFWKIGFLCLPLSTLIERENEDLVYSYQGIMWMLHL